MSEQSVPVRQDGVVDPQILQNLNDRQRRAGQNTLLQPCLVEEANVLVHVEDVPVTEPLDILAGVRDLLQILILAVVEDGVIHYDTIHGVVVIGSKDMLFEIFAVGFAQLEFEAAGALSDDLLWTRAMW